MFEGNVLIDDYEVGQSPTDEGPSDNNDQELSDLLTKMNRESNEGLSARMGCLPPFHDPSLFFNDSSSYYPSILIAGSLPSTGFFQEKNDADPTVVPKGHGLKPMGFDFFQGKTDHQNPMVGVDGSEKPLFLNHDRKCKIGVAKFGACGGGDGGGIVGLLVEDDISRLSDQHLKELEKVLMLDLNSVLVHSFGDILVLEQRLGRIERLSPNQDPDAPLSKKEKRKMRKQFDITYLSSPKYKAHMTNVPRSISLQKQPKRQKRREQRHNHQMNRW